MRRLIFAFLSICTIASATPAFAQSLDWLERYAFLGDRSSVLNELIPGSEDYYFYHCLHYQVSGESEKAEALLAQWKADLNAKNSRLIQGSEDRQRLLTYNRSADRSIDYFRTRLNIKLNHTPPLAVGEVLYPSTFDNAALEPNSLIDTVEQGQLTPSGLRRLAARVLADEVTLARPRLTALLDQIDGPWMPNLDQLIIKEQSLVAPFSQTFGDRQAHQWLTLEQLQIIAKAVPNLATSDGMVAAVLLRLRPSDDEDMRQQPEVRTAYLERIERYVNALPEAYLSLKAATVYQRLQHDLSRGDFNRDRFIRYLKLPRRGWLVPEVKQSAPHLLADLGTDFNDLAMIPAIGDEQPLIRTYLEHFLKDAESTAAFDGLLLPNYLRSVFAETKLLHGVEPSDRWFAVLETNQRPQIRDRVELTLAPTNPRTHDATKPSSLVLDLKQIDKLVVRIYRINTPSYYRTRTNQVDTDIDLDGLIPTIERQIDYSFPLTRRHRETIELPEIQGRGVWIVDLLGGGLRARAMIRRGDLRYTISQSANGVLITAMDENRKPIAGAKLMIASQEWVANEDGQIDIPPVDKQVERVAVLHDDSLAIPVTFTHLAESYSLQAAMYVDRQQLQTANQADLIIRPRLLMSDKAIDPSTLQEVFVTVTATDLDEIATTKRYEKLTLNQSGELVLSLRVPPRLATLSAVLSGKIRGLAKNDLRDLSVSQSWNIASMRKTMLTSAAHLTRDADNWVIETRGRGGESIAGKMVQVRLHPSVRQEAIFATLQSDKSGRIQLGKLNGINTIDITCDGQLTSMPLRSIDTTWPTRIHANVGTTVRLPIPIANVDATRFRLLRLRSDRPEADLSSLMVLKDGLLTIDQLTAGDYQLHDLELGNQLRLCITAGPVVGDVAVGEVRQLEWVPRSELGIGSVERNNEGLRIQLSGSTSLTRVHIISRRFVDSVDPLEQLRLPNLRLTTRGVWNATCGYISDLRLGEEYQYVMRRQFAAKYPGVLLPQPGLILNPWETRSTENETQTAATGDAPMAAAVPGAPMMDSGEVKGRDRSSSEALTLDYDFLKDSGAVVTNLMPDRDGVISIPAAVIDGMPIVQVIAADPMSIVRRSVYQSLDDAKVADLRLAKALDAQRALAFARGVVLATPDKPLDLKTLGSAQVQLYSSVSDLMRLYMTLQNDDRLKPFQAIGSWHTLDNDAKRSLYSRLACHELHLFLSQHDPKFFNDATLPFLRNKAEKQFIDHYLLDDDLTPWTQMWRYRELNAAEKVLLAKRIPAMAKTVPREFSEWIQMQPEDSDLLRKLIESGLAGSSMSEKLQDRQMELGKANANFNAMGGGMGGAVGSNGKQESDFAMVFGAPLSMAQDPFAESEGLQIRRESARRISRSKSLSEESDSSKDKAFFGRDARAARLSLFQNLDSTKEWAESHWDHVRINDPNLIPIDRFWLALASDTGEKPTLNEHLLRPITSHHSALAALAFCGLPLESGDIKLPTDDKPFTPPHPVALVTKRLIELKAMDGEASLLVGQRFAKDGSTSGNDPNADVPVAPDEFVVHLAYRGEVILSNPTPKRRTVDVLWQIPAGSLPLAGGLATDSRTMTLEPFAVQRIEYAFYFPSAGNFIHYPVSVGIDGQLVARGNERTFNVVATPSKLDEESWPAVAASGDATKIDAFLAKANLRKIDLGLVAHRMKDRAIYDVVTRQLFANQINKPELWGYAFHHRDISGMRTFLSQQATFVNDVGPAFQSDLLEVDPVDRHLYELLEYSPLVQARIHPLKDERDILNPTFKQQYVNLLRVLAHQSQAEVTQRLSIVYFLLLQNRIEEAVQQFEKVDADQVETKLQYDYLAGYLALHRSDFAAATKLALENEDHPVPRWQERFSTLLSNVRQREQLLQGSGLAATGNDRNNGVLPDDADLSLAHRDQRNANAAATESFLKVDVDGASIKIEHRNTKNATVNLYAVDLELLFSKTPFVREDLATMAMVEPTRTERIDMDSKDGVHQLRLDEKLARQTLLVEVVSGAARSTTLYYGGKLSAYVSQGFGQLQVADSVNRQPVEGAYVKVYARHQDGSVSFYKDGYTDLRGRFDYASLSTGELATTQRFAILVIDSERGATLQEAAPPSS